MASGYLGLGGSARGSAGGGGLEITPKPGRGGRGSPGYPAPRSAELPHHLLLSGDSLVSLQLRTFNLVSVQPPNKHAQQVTGKLKAREGPGLELVVLKPTGSFGLCRTSLL